jgi:hypothetical protein
MAAFSACAQYGGVAVILRPDAGETRCMLQDRAWATARSMTAFETTEAQAAACRAWVWARHTGCGYDADIGHVLLHVDAAMSIHASPDTGRALTKPSAAAAAASVVAVPELQTRACSSCARTPAGAAGRPRRTG